MIIPADARSFVARVLLVVAVIATIVAGLWLTPAMQEFDRRVQDSVVRLQSPRGVSPHVVLVVIDDASLARYGRWPWPRTTLATLVSEISRRQPRVIGLDLLLSEPQTGSADVKLAEAMRQAGNVVLVSKISNSAAGPLWVDPLPEFSAAAAGIGHAQAVLDSDGICRTYPPLEMSVGGPRKAFAIEVASHADEQLSNAFLRRAGVWSSLESSANIQTLAPALVPLSFRPGQFAFTSISAADLLDGKSVPQLKGRVVLVGFGATELHDKLITPLGGPEPTIGVEIHAHAIDAILSGRFLQETNPVLEIVFFVLISGMSTAIALHFSVARALFATVVIAVASYAGAYFLLAFFERSTHLAPILAGIVMALPASYIARLLSIDRALSRQLRTIETVLEMTGKSSSASAEKRVAGTDWKLAVLEQLQARLADDYRFEHTLLESTRDCIAVFRQTGELSFCNNRFRTLWGEAADGREPTLSALSELLEFPIGRDLAGGHSEEEVFIRRNLWSLRSTRIESETSEADVMVVLTDLRTRMERDQARAEALSFVTHELRTPLVAIQGFAELMMRTPVSNNEAPEVIFRESRRLVSLINSYLDVLRLDSGARPLTLEAVQVNVIVAHVLKVLQPLADGRGVKLASTVRPDGLTITCDGALISGALLNLVSNAIKYGDPAGTVRLSVVANENEITFSVWNAGKAISASEISHVFDPYYRGSAEGRQQGWGIGLAFVKRIAQKHNGHLAVHSSDEEGTEFQFKLRLAVTETTIKEAIPQC